MTDTQTRRASAGAATYERPLYYGPLDPLRAPRPPAVPPVSHPQAALRFATGVALVIALAATLFTIQGLAQLSRSRSHIAALQADVSSLQQRMRMDERAAAMERRHVQAATTQATGAARALQQLSWQLASLPTEAEVAHLRGGLALSAVCVPQLQREIARLGIAWRVDAHKPKRDYFKPFTAAPISRTCATALTGR